MVLFPNCKINLGLRALRKRADGYHDLDTIFYPLALHDALEILPASETDIKEIAPVAPLPDQPVVEEPENHIFLHNDCYFSVSGLPIPGEAADNLCLKAWSIIKKDFPSLPPIRMHLHKAIAIGGGLGGGSADAAFALTLLNRQFALGLSTEQLKAYALQLGSDCPFFILNKPCLATGRGEQLREIELDLSSYCIALVDPAIHISTAWAFSMLRPAEREQSLQSIITLPIERWKEELTNDFEQPVFGARPELAAIKNELYQLGAVYAGMTGTGSTIVGIFKTKPSEPSSLLRNYRLIFL